MDSVSCSLGDIFPDCYKQIQIKPEARGDGVLIDFVYPSRDIKERMYITHDKLKTLISILEHH